MQKEVNVRLQADLKFVNANRKSDFTVQCSSTVVLFFNGESTFDHLSAASIT